MGSTRGVGEGGRDIDEIMHLAWEAYNALQTQSGQPLTYETHEFRCHPHLYQRLLEMMAYPDWHGYSWIQLFGLAVKADVSCDPDRLVLCEVVR